ncbi:MAG: phytanoyl-CoA dioxygenase family protein, partial [Paenibacillus sp.]|nr:phytanoyl-CoA dioxygenase family protein [Paenibacillus sp.]
YGNLSQTKMVCGVWIALDEARLDNGCMHVIPGTHLEGAVPHFAVRDWQICDSQVEVARDVVVPLKPGGALFFAGMLHHGTPPNLSEYRRRALQFHYCPESSEKMTPKQFKEVFTSEMSDAEC